MCSILWGDSLAFRVFALFLFIHIIPSCDSTITFTKSTYNFNISENNAFKSVLGNVLATSSDGQTVSYSIVSGNDNGFFTLNGNNGSLRTNASLNYEFASEYILSVAAQAGVVGTAFVNIHVSH